MGIGRMKPCSRIPGSTVQSEAAHPEPEPLPHHREESSTKEDQMTKHKSDWDAYDHDEAAEAPLGWVHVNGFGSVIGVHVFAWIRL